MTYLVMLLLSLTVVASPFVAFFHVLLFLAKRRFGIRRAVFMYFFSVVALAGWVYWYLDQLMARIDAGVYDGPVGFGAGLFGGFIMLFSGIVVILNGIGLWLLARTDK